MKKKEKQSLQGMSDDELNKRIVTLEAEIAKGKLDGATKQGKNTRVFRSKRRQIAVAKTILSIRHI